MSRQIVHDEHIRVMVWAGLRSHPGGPLSWTVDHGSSRYNHQLLAEGAAEIGAMLHEQNVAAYTERYGEDEDEDDLADTSPSYVHASPERTNWTAVDLFKALEFYVYQSFHEEDHDEAISVEALQFCGALAGRIGPELPGWGGPAFPAAMMGSPEWERSPWGIEGADRS